MTYAISDLHGCFGKYRRLLKRIDFSLQDTMYVLGDVLDRGPSGFQILKDIISRPNMLMQKGNHEVMAIAALPSILRYMNDSGNTLSEEETGDIELWFYNGGSTSLKDFLTLSQDERDRSMDYLSSLPLYRELEVNGRKFVLIHGGLENFAPERPLSDYTEPEIVWSRPEHDTVYYPDKYVILGHTPTPFLYEEIGEETPRAKFFKTDSFIDIDCGCVFNGGQLGCLCLDTMEEIYI